MDITFRPEDIPLRRDVNTLGRLLGEVLQQLGAPGLYERVEAARHAAIDRRSNKADSTERFEDLLRGTTPSDGIEIVRAFAAYFDLVNMAERVHRIRRRRDYLRSGKAQPDSFEDAILRLKREGVEAQTLADILASLDFTAVFTAHPTEATRRTLLAKQQRIARALVDRLEPDRILPQEDATALAQVRAELGVAWQTEPHSAQPSVADEVEHVVFYLTDVVYRIVPAIYQRLEESVEAAYGAEAGVSIPRVLRFGTWVGGDMDGNPKVGPATMRATLTRQRQLILQRYRREIRDLFDHMSHSRSRVDVLPVVEATLERYRERFPEVYAEIPARYHTMPYRMLLWLVSARVDATERESEGAYAHPNELLADLRVIHRSLDERSGPGTGQHRVQRLIRRVETFGFHLATLDIRQDASVHRAACAELIAGYAELGPGERVRALEGLIADPPREPRAAPGGALATCLDVMRTIGELQRRFGKEAIGPYIISMAQGPDDVLAVLALARAAGLVGEDGHVPLDIAPLFETVPDLEGAAAALEAMLGHAHYAGHVAHRAHQQLVMLGYSDSNKESGLASSRWALHEAQRELLKVAEAHPPVRLTLFHGRGGTISRGGGKPRQGIMAQPRGAVSGRLRITEQGEIIAMKYGLRDIAARTIELQLGAALEHTATSQQRPDTPPAWLEAAAFLARTSREAYRRLVFDDPSFIPYFRAATPIDVIERLRIGSRPASRKGDPTVAGLRAIPWVFAWTQSRHLLPGWYGLGTGLQATLERFGEITLRDMVRGWPYFATLLADAEMVLAKTDLPIAAYYSELANDGGRGLGDKLFPGIRAEYERTCALVCQLRGTSVLLEREPVLQRAIRLRNPYVDPMSLLQVDYLRRWRASDRTDPELELALMTTVRGIAQGMQNTG